MIKTHNLEKYIQKDSSFCTGCAACFNGCPFDAITMEEDCEGFLFPSIDHEKCKECGICVRICPSINLRTASDSKIPNVFAYINSNEKIRMESSSGGCFTALAQKILNENGVVYGAGFDNRWEVVHQSACTEKDLNNLRMSKYVQSKVGNTYRKVIKDLQNGRSVMFVGTPCQCEGLKNILPEEFPNLVLVDFICHGVPSPLVWRKYLGWISHNNLNLIKKILW